jgi:uncharacterized protein YuzE
MEKKFPYSEFINDILRSGERRIVGLKNVSEPIEITIDEKGTYVGVPFFHCDAISNSKQFEKVVRDVMINLKINPSILTANEMKTISFESHEIGKRASIVIHKSSVMLTSGIEEINAITEIPYLLACVSLLSAIYFWKNPQMLEATEDGTHCYAFGFRFISPYILTSQLPLLEKMEKQENNSEKASELFTLRIVSEVEDASNLSVEDFWMDPIK